MSILTEIKNAYAFPEKLQILDPDKVEKILAQLVEKGPDALQIITDFDHTLTKFKTEDGLHCDTCHGIVDHSSLVPDEFRQQTKDLRDKYYPIEIDHGVPLQEKIPLMIEWYTKSQNVIVEFQFTKMQIKQMVLKSRAFLRDNAEQVLILLHKFQVPVLIFSAGVGNILENVLERDSVLFPNIQVVSNYMEFDSSDRVIGFRPPLIHMFNKNESVIASHHPKYFDALVHRCNALVLGDSLGDVDMNRGMPTKENDTKDTEAEGAVLKIGFLNDKINERIGEFMENFDIVLVDDQTFQFVQLILDRILHGST